MIWLNSDAAERQLSAQEFTDAESFKYLLAILIVTTLSGYFPSEFDSTWARISDCTINLVIVVAGLYKLYQTNNQLDGKDFFKRLLLISWVAGWQMALCLFLPLGFLAGLYTSIFSYTLFPGSMAWQLVQVLFSGGVTAVYFLMMNRSFKRLQPIKFSFYI